MVVGSVVVLHLISASRSSYRVRQAKYISLLVFLALNGLMSYSVSLTFSMLGSFTESLLRFSLFGNSSRIIGELGMYVQSGILRFGDLLRMCCSLLAGASLLTNPEICS